MTINLKTNTIILLGASSYIGKHLLRSEQWTTQFNIRAVSHHGIKNKQIQATNRKIEYITADLDDYQSVQAILLSDSIVINLAYSWLGGEAENLRMINNIVEASKNKKIKRLIHCSTAAVVGRASDELVTEFTSCFPVTPYGQTKLKIENLLLAHGNKYFDMAILRPTSVFGPEGEPLKKLAGEMVGASRTRNYLKSCLFGARRMNLVPINNVLTALILLASNAKDLEGQTFFVSDDNSPENNFVYVSRVLMKKLNIPKYPIPKVLLPLGLLGFLLRVMGRNNINPRCNFSSEKLRKLGFVPQVTFQDALNEYAEWYRASLAP